MMVLLSIAASNNYLWILNKELQRLGFVAWQSSLMQELFYVKTLLLLMSPIIIYQDVCHTTYPCIVRLVIFLCKDNKQQVVKIIPFFLVT